jgi:hypothetical protein
MPLLLLVFCWLALLCILFSPQTSEARRTVAVKGHPTKSGTYIPSHKRTTPNATRLDNYDTKGMVNPHTGKMGAQDPFAPKELRRPHGHP